MEGVDLENQGGSNLGLFTLSNQQEVIGPRIAGFRSQGERSRLGKEV